MARMMFSKFSPCAGFLCKHCPFTLIPTCHLVAKTLVAIFWTYVLTSIQDCFSFLVRMMTSPAIMPHFNWMYMLTRTVRACPYARKSVYNLQIHFQADTCWAFPNSLKHSVYVIPIFNRYIYHHTGNFASIIHSSSVK